MTELNAVAGLQVHGSLEAAGAMLQVTGVTLVTMHHSEPHAPSVWHALFRFRRS